MATATITPDQTAVIAEIFIAAPPARVFQAISDPTQLPKWWGQTGLYHVTKSTMDAPPRRQVAQRRRRRRRQVLLRRRRISGSRSPAPARPHLDRQLQWPGEDHRPLGTRAAQRSRTAAQRSEEIRHRHSGARPPGRFRQPSNPPPPTAKAGSASSAGWKRIDVAETVEPSRILSG